MLLCADEVAQKLSVSTRTVQRLAAEGRLQSVRLDYRTTRYTAASLAALIDPSSTSSAPADTEALRKVVQGDRDAGYQHQ
jgi:excisionase family DNA binding protein